MTAFMIPKRLQCVCVCVCVCVYMCKRVECVCVCVCVCSFISGGRGLRGKVEREGRGSYNAPAKNPKNI